MMKSTYFLMVIVALIGFAAADAALKEPGNKVQVEDSGLLLENNKIYMEKELDSDMESTETKIRKYNQPSPQYYSG